MSINQAVMMASCNGPPDSFVQGSATVRVSGFPLVRIGDTTAHGGVVVFGSPVVNVGG